MPATQQYTPACVKLARRDNAREKPSHECRACHGTHHEGHAKTAMITKKNSGSLTVASVAHSPDRTHLRQAALDTPDKECI
jgi:nitrate/TMAO reductase-like tetraheme cytochrome c subunit